MSYDLYFIGPDFSYEQFATYFSDRPNFRLSDKQALYENEDTGVFFVFEYSNEELEYNEPIRYCASFNLNYYRPHFFALEAEPEVRNFVDHFGFKTFDPQEVIEGNEYSTEGFLRGWNAGNEFTCKAILSSDDAPPEIFVRPTKELDGIWGWNYARESRQEQLGEDIFVPKIFFVLLNNDLHSTIIWTDAISTLIPLVDVVGVYRMNLVPRRPPPRRKYLPRRLPQKKKEDMCFVTFDDAQPLIKTYEVQDYNMPAFFLGYSSPPADILRFVKSLKPFAGQRDLVGMDHVLNSELVKKHKQP